jgi:hypothetical protein
MKTIDEHYSTLCDRAHEQTVALGNQFTAIIDGLDEDGEECKMRPCGIRKESDGRSVFVFAEPGVEHALQIVYVDAILALADLIRREVPVT